MARTAAKSSNPKTSRAFLDSSASGALPLLAMPVLFGGSIVSQFFTIAGVNIRYYSLFLVAAIIAAFLIARSRAKRQGIAPAVFEDTAFWVVIVGFICARIYYVLFYFDQYRNNLSEIYKVWHGGIGIYGALIGGILTLVYICKKRHLDFWKIFDSIVFALPVAQIIGRLGNFFNYEAFGKPTNLPWKMYVPPQFRPPGYAQFAYFHPTFLYEMIWSAIVFGLLWFFARKNPKAGVLSGLYLVLYSIGRFAIESIRLDSAYFFGQQGIRGDQITALLLILAGLAIIVSRYRHASQDRQ